MIELQDLKETDQNKISQNYHPIDQIDEDSESLNHEEQFMRAVNFPPKTNKNLDPKKEFILLDKNVRMLHFSSKNSIHGAYN
jgi:hypothetical protein